MLDRFKDAKWYVRSERGRHDRIDPLSTIIYDASDLDGTGPDGHGVVCLGATLEDARLIAASPDLLAAAKAALDRLCDPYLGEDDGERQRPEIAALEQAIAKAEGPSGGYARLLDTDPKFEAWVRGCVDKAEGRA